MDSSHSSQSSDSDSTDVVSVSTTTKDTSSEPSSFSAFLCLRQPAPSDFARKRRVQQNPPPVGKRRARGHGAFDPKSVCPSQRVREFPNEDLTVSNKKLFCNACREEVGLKSSVVHNHVRSNKHKLGKNRLARKDVTERDIAAAFTRTQQEEHPGGETLPEEERVYRVRVVQAFLCTATPLNKLAHFWGLFEENALRLTDK